MKPLTEKYFSILRDYFEPIAKLENKHKYPRDQTMQVLPQIYDISTLKSTLDCLYGDLSKLDWTSQEQSLRDMTGVRTSYVGIDIQGTKEEALGYLKRICLYSDIIIMNDPLLSELRAWKMRKERGYVPSFMYVTDFALNLLGIEDLFLADSDPPICVLAPSLVWNLQERKLLEKVDDLSTNCSLAYASEVFDRHFTTIAELRTFLSRVKEASEFLSLAKKPEMLEDGYGNALTSERLSSMKTRVELTTERTIRQTDLFVKIIRARFPLAIYNTTCNGAYSTSFTTDLRGVWNNLLWLMRKDNASLFELSKMRGISKDSLIIKALQQERLTWLGNIPLDRIKEIRREGELQDLRELICRNVDEIRNVEDEDFLEIGKQVRYNLDQALRKHETELKSLDEGFRKKYRIDAATLLVSGTFAISSALYPPLSQVLGIASSISGGYTITEMLRNYLEKRDEIKDLQRKPVAILFDAKNA